MSDSGPFLDLNIILNITNYEHFKSLKTRDLFGLEMTENSFLEFVGIVLGHSCRAGSYSLEGTGALGADPAKRQKLEPEEEEVMKRGGVEPAWGWLPILQPHEHWPRKTLAQEFGVLVVA